MAFGAPIGQNPFQQGGMAQGGMAQGGMAPLQNPMGGMPPMRQGGANSPTGPMLGPGSELRRLYNMPPDMGHASAVQSMGMFDNKVYTAGRDNQLFIWRPSKPNGRDIVLEQDCPPINLSSSANCMLYEPSSKWLFLGLWNGKIQAYCKEPVRDQVLQGHQKCVSSLAIHSSVVISGSHDATVRLWTANPQAGNFQPCGQALPNPTGPVNSVKVFNDTLWVGADQGITCFDLNTLQAKGSIPAPAGVTSMIDFQGYMLVAFKNGEVKIFDGAGAQTYVHPPQGEHTTNTAVELMMHPYTNKPILLCGQEFGYVTAYDLPDFRPRGTFYAKNQSHIRSIVDVKAEGMFLTAGQHGDVMMWQWQPEGAGGSDNRAHQGGGMGMGGGSGSGSNVPSAANPFAPSGGMGGMAAGGGMQAANPFAPSGGGGGGGGFGAPGGFPGGGMMM